MNTEPIRILFVCTGNICRSPSAEGIFRHLVDERGLGHRFEVESAGISAYHVGERPDSRSSKEALRHGVDLSSIRSSQIHQSDFETFDLLLAMDYGHYQDMKAMAGSKHASKVRMFLEHIKDQERIGEVPDPYYGGPQGFRNVFELVKRGCESWIDALI